MSFTEDKRRCINLKLIKVENYQKLSKIASEIIINKVKQSDKLTLGLATGSTPEGLYRYLVEDHVLNQTDYQQIKTFNLDEYVGIPPENKNSYFYYMNHHLFNHINILPNNIHLPNGLTDDFERECRHYEDLIDQTGGIDLQILGVGLNGHIGFNEPNTSFESKTHVVKLDECTREANARFFQTLEEVPTHAITMGISTILKSKEILLLVSGDKKKATLQRLLDCDISENFPASILKKHPHLTIITDNIA